MSLKYWILLMFVIAICSRSSAQFCSRSYVGGKWISEGDCGGPEMMSSIMRELEDRAKDEKMKPTEKPSEDPTVKTTEKSTENPTAKHTEKPTETSPAKPTENPTVFQRRIRGDVDFYRNWTDYVEGFGNSKGDFWLGLDKLHEMTKDGNMELEINMIKKGSGIHWSAKYSSFRIGPGSDNYRLQVSGYTGNATGDAFSYHNNDQFTTYDADHDRWSDANCASHYEAAWWYNACGNQNNLNGNFHKTDGKGIWWLTYTNRLSFSEMKFRRRS